MVGASITLSQWPWLVAVLVVVSPWDVQTNCFQSTRPPRFWTTTTIVSIEHFGSCSSAQVSRGFVFHLIALPVLFCISSHSLTDSRPHTQIHWQHMPTIYRFRLILIEFVLFWFVQNGGDAEFVTWLTDWLNVHWLVYVHYAKESVCVQFQLTRIKLLIISTESCKWNGDDARRWLLLPRSCNWLKLWFHSIFFHFIWFLSNFL